MFFQANWDIGFKNSKGEWRLGILSECVIEKSHKNLADTATILLPESDMNHVFRVQDEIKRGDYVVIKLGYDANLVSEFEGYIKEIIAVDGSLVINCEDALFLFRNDIKDKQFKPATVKTIAEYLVSQIDKTYKVVCDYDIPYDKFTIYQATAYDVLAKIQEETGADIYFDTKNKELHIHPAYTRKTGEAAYCFQVNIEEGSSIEWKNAEDKNVEITVESVGLDGKVIQHTVGKAGGEKITRKVGRMSKEAIKLIAETEYKNTIAPGYEGQIDSWLIPYCEPGYSIIIDDKDYPERDGVYYAEAVKISFSDAGGKRSITPGIKLSK